MKRMLLVFTAIIILFVAGCRSGTPAPPPKPGGGLIVNNDSAITGKIQAIRKATTGYPWDVDVLIQTTQDVDNLTNLTKDKVGIVITARTEEDMSQFKAGQTISAHIKLAGDAVIGTYFFIYQIKSQ